MVLRRTILLLVVLTKKMILKRKFQLSSWPDSQQNTIALPTHPHKSPLSFFRQQRSPGAVPEKQLLIHPKILSKHMLVRFPLCPTTGVIVWRYIQKLVRLLKHCKTLKAQTLYSPEGLTKNVTQGRDTLARLVTMSRKLTDAMNLDIFSMNMPAMDRFLQLQTTQHIAVSTFP